MAIQGPVLESKDMYSYGFSGNGEKTSEKAKICTKFENKMTARIGPDL